jgi:hypothetical protein
MPSRPIELPPRVPSKGHARIQPKQDDIASRQLHALLAFQRPRDKKLRLANVKETFRQMKDHA